MCVTQGVKVRRIHEFLRARLVVYMQQACFEVSCTPVHTCMSGRHAGARTCLQVQLALGGVAACHLRMGLVQPMRLCEGGFAGGDHERF